MKRALGEAFLKTYGWKLATGKPDAKKYVLIAAPHTSNWDFAFMMAMAAILDIDLRFLGKHTLFKPPFGALLKAAGGISVDRRAAHNLVDALVRVFDQNEELVLAVPAEGTRGKGKYWKSGFYHIARGANVPIALGYLDYKTKTGGIGPLVMPTGDVRKDMDVIRAFYAGLEGKQHEHFTPPRLREEDAS
jgi:1-acyl-sn-glycerol-3-phosphate acyltransferase